MEYLGEKAFKIKTKTMTVIIEPCESCKKQTADIVVTSKGLAGGVKGPVKREKVFVIDRPGEYEMGEVEIRTMPVNGDMITIIYAEDVNLVHLGSVKVLTEKQMGELSTAEVLMMPVDGKKELVSKLAPLLLIPMGYESGSEVDKFVSDGGFDNVRRTKKLSLKQADLPEDMQVVIMG